MMVRRAPVTIRLMRQYVKVRVNAKDKIMKR